MALTVDGDSLFGTGPSIVIDGPWRRPRKDAMFPALAGQSRLTMGTAGRPILQTGRLVATGATASAAADALQALADAIDAAVSTGEEHTLVTADGRTFRNCALDDFGWGGRIIVYKSGAATYTAARDYVARWTQMAPNDVVEE